MMIMILLNDRKGGKADYGAKESRITATWEVFMLDIQKWRR